MMKILSNFTIKDVLYFLILFVIGYFLYQNLNGVDTKYMKSLEDKKVEYQNRIDSLKNVVSKGKDSIKVFDEKIKRYEKVLVEKNIKIKTLKDEIKYKKEVINNSDVSFSYDIVYKHLDSISTTNKKN
ncbi:hypothetical protein BPT24_120 [Tenacibaculum phage pT24]|uniref:Uncharacterized protein n=1 Tax=Tenacibaculum phage pT24 TaxID=1880590 RepID=A0A1B4XWS4_9CAUD|nr:hypothetical protein HYP10_gp120 [Tenacibaculum phage pT24]BAV39245.1 hypothetical protein BPT24_120 [Tenacibaculum phage pT24]